MMKETIIDHVFGATVAVCFFVLTHKIAPGIWQLGKNNFSFSAAEELFFRSGSLNKFS